MEGNIIVFNHPMFGEIRVAGTAENPLFCLSDVCKVLELRVDGVMPRLKEGGYNRIGVGVQTGVKKDGTPAIQNVEMVFVNEQNLYKVIMRSDKPQAEPFQDWVCGEVLPSIRKHGAYMTEATIEKVMNDPESWIKLLTTLKEEREQRRLAEQEKERLAYENEQQLTVIRQQAPKVEYFQKFMSSQHGTTSTGIRELVKQAHIKNERKFIDWMEKNGILYRGKSKKGKKGSLRPYKDFTDCFEYYDVYNETNDWSGKHLKFNPFGKLKIVEMYHTEHPEEFDVIEGLLQL